MESKSGIYQIKNNRNGLRYIGSTMYLSVRKEKDWHRLKIGVHPNRRLQSDYNRYGKKAFTFEVIEQVERKLDLIEREQYHIDRFSWDDLYNVDPKNFGG